MAVRGLGCAVMPHLEKRIAASCIVRVEQARNVLHEYAKTVKCA